MKHLKKYNHFIFESVSKDIKDRFVELCEEKQDMLESELSNGDRVTLNEICGILKKEYPDFAQIEVECIPTDKSGRSFFDVSLRVFQTQQDVEDGEPNHYKQFEVEEVQNSEDDF